MNRYLLRRLMRLNVIPRKGSGKRADVPGYRVGGKTGTADLALMIARLHPTAKVIGSDPSSRMLGVGQDKVAKSGVSDRVTLEVGDAQALPYENESFDIIYYDAFAPSKQPEMWYLPLIEKSFSMLKSKGISRSASVWLRPTFPSVIL